MNLIRAAVVQAAPVAFDRQRTLDKTSELAAVAAGRGAPIDRLSGGVRFRLSAGCRFWRCRVANFRRA